MEFEDEFEEFRARASSGGFLPSRKPRRRCQCPHEQLQPRPSSHSATQGYLADTEDYLVSGSDYSLPLRAKSNSSLTDTSVSLTNTGDSQWTYSNKKSLTTSTNITGKDSHSGVYLSSGFVNIPPRDLHLDILKDVEWIVGDPRPRVCSMPAHSATTLKPSRGHGGRSVTPTLRELADSRRNTSGDGIHKVRSFVITPKGVLEEGSDTRAKSKSASTFSELPSSSTIVCKSCDFLQKQQAPLCHSFASDSTTQDFRDSTGTCSLHSDSGSVLSVLCVVVTGLDRVGKTTIIRRFISSDYSQDSSFGEFESLYVASQQTQKHLYNMYTMLDQRRRRWTDVVLMLYKCFVFAGMSSSQQQLLTTKVADHKYATFEGQTCCIIVDGSMLGERSPRWPTTEPRLALPT